MFACQKGKRDRIHEMCDDTCHSRQQGELSHLDQGINLDSTESVVPRGNMGTPRNEEYCEPITLKVGKPVAYSFTWSSLTR